MLSHTDITPRNSHKGKLQNRSNGRQAGRQVDCQAGRMQGADSDSKPNHNTTLSRFFAANWASLRERTEESHSEVSRWRWRRRRRRRRQRRPHMFMLLCAHAFAFELSLCLSLSLSLFLSHWWDGPHVCAASADTTTRWLC